MNDKWAMLWEQKISEKVLFDVTVIGRSMKQTNSEFCLALQFYHTGNDEV
jgi:hypothetical protein